MNAITEPWDEDTLWGKDVALAISMADKDMPLKELLLCMMQKMADCCVRNEAEKEILEVAKAKWMLVVDNQCTIWPGWGRVQLIKHTSLYYSFNDSSTPCMYT